MKMAGLNALAMMRFGRFAGLRGGQDGFAWLLIGLLAIGIAVWAVSRSQHSEPAKN
jgi:hypothetical protein